MLRIKACGLSDVGMARSHNEDCFGIDPENLLFVVADGMGGHSHGEVASRIAVDSVQEFIERTSPRNRRRRSAEGRRRMATVDMETTHSELTEEDTTDIDLDDAYPGQTLEKAIHSAHDRVLGAIREDGSLYGMGTTLVGILVRHGVAAIAHVGDSRAYRIRDGEMRLITQDHTWVNEQVVAGFLSEEQARVHPLKNVITRALGGESEVQVDVDQVNLVPGDLYMLCSDGLTTMLTDNEIHQLVEQENSLEDVCRALVQEANDRGGVDNITVLLFEVEELLDDEVTQEA